MKKLALIFIAFAFCSLVGGQSILAGEYKLTPCDDVKFDISYDGPPIKVKLSHHAPETHPIMANVFIPWIEEVKKVTKGKLIIERFMGGTLHDAKDGFKAASTDITDITAGYTIWQSTSFNMDHIMALPFAFENVIVATMVGTELYPKYFKKEYENMGVVLAAYLTTTPHNILSKKEIGSVGEFKGKKISCPAGPSSDMLKTLGGVPVTLPTPEIYSGFQRGLVDGTFQTTADMINWKTYELGNFHQELNLTISSLPHCMNKKTFDSLPPSLKKPFYTMLQLLALENAIFYDWNTTDAIDKMKKKGLKFVVYSPAEMKLWKDPLQPMWDEFINKNESKGLPAKKAAEELAALRAKYEKMSVKEIREMIIKDPVKGIIDGM
jgi:TRAP-type C4-dicarboxylate transport system substrate-binding protein